MTADLGFKYIQRLCKVIETFTDNAEASNPDTFKYRQADLKYAVERSLYFSFVNNHRLFTLFGQWFSGALPEIIEMRTELERELALYLCGNNLASDRVRVKPSLLPRLRQWAHDSFVSLLLRLPVAPLSKAKQPTVLVYVIHEKFVRYLLPITDRLPVSFAYLLTLNLRLKSFLVKHQLPFIRSTSPFHQFEKFIPIFLAN